MLSLLAESWTWYAFSVLIVAARYASRWLQFGSIKAFQAEDYVMLFVFAFYTSLISFMNIVAHLNTNLMLPDDIPLLTPESIASRIRGSKLVLVVEQSMIMTQWGCKICLLLLYNKLTFGLKQQLAVKIVGGYVVINFVVMEILYLGVWCRPFYQYWAVPVENEQCSAAIHHLITNAVFNISSDLMMLCIPLPLLIKSQLPRTNKVILCVLFGLGIFVILCAVLNKFYSFAQPFSPMWTFWYVREASTAIYVANMPMCWSLMRRLFNLRAFNGTSSNGARSGSKSLPIATTYSGTAAGSRIGGSSKVGAAKAGGSKVEVSAPESKIDRSGGAKNNSWWGPSHGKDVRIGRSESEEYIFGGGRKDVPLEIWESREVEINRGSVRYPAGNWDMGMRTRMYDGVEKEYETTTTVTVQGPIGRNPRKSDSGSRSS